MLLTVSALTYLSRRSRRVVIHANVFETFNVPYRVPQGSCLGPLLFTMYANKLFYVIEKRLYQLNIEQLYIAFSLTEKPGESVAVNAMEG